MRVVEIAAFVFVAYLLLPNILAYGVEAVKLSKIAEGKYRCCLEEPCNYCLLKYGECDCLDEVMNYEVPCGECLGEIIEGEGNKLISDMFPVIIEKAISGESHE